MSSIKEMAEAKRLFEAMEKVCHASAALLVFLDNKGMGQIPIVKNLRELVLQYDVEQRRFNEEVVEPMMNSKGPPS